MIEVSNFCILLFAVFIAPRGSFGGLGKTESKTCDEYGKSECKKTDTKREYQCNHFFIIGYSLLLTIINRANFIACYH